MRHPVLLLLLLLASSWAHACGTFVGQKQEILDRDDLGAERTFARALAAQADLIFIGTVIKLDTRRLLNGTDEGKVVLQVDEMLKGPADRKNIGLWYTSHFVMSCRPSEDQFRHVHFRHGMKYIVYAAKGVVRRSAPVDRPASAARVGLEAEREIARDPSN